MNDDDDDERCRFCKKGVYGWGYIKTFAMVIPY